MKPTDQETVAVEKSLLLSSQEEGARQTTVREAPGSVRRQKGGRGKAWTRAWNRVVCKFPGGSRVPGWALLSGACPLGTGAGGLECETREGMEGVGCRLVGWLACTRRSKRPVVVSRNWLTLAGGATIRPAKLQISKRQKYRR